jgi:hypothetical protein
MQQIKKHFLSSSTGKLSLFVIIATMIAIIYINLDHQLWIKKHGVVRHDVVSYYSYLPAAFIFNDLSFGFLDDDPDYFYDKMYRFEAPDGGKYQKVSMGLSFLYLPFFLAGHVTAYITGAELSGYSPPYMFFLLFSSSFYLLLAMLMLRKVLLSYNKDWIVALTLLTVIPGTHIIHYTTFEAAMPHVFNFFLFTLFIWLTIKWFRKKSLRNSVLLGLTFGMISLIRPSNVIIALFFMLYNVKSLADLFARPKFFLKQWKHILLILLSIFVVWLPQLIFWKANTGHWFFYSYEGESFFFTNPQIVNGLFSFRKGWLLYTPAMVLALVGIAFLYKIKREFFLPILVFTLLNIYILFSWWAWWYGGSFGMRAMIDAYPLMALSLAAVISIASKQSKLLKVAVIGICCLFTLHGIYQTVQYRYGSLHWDSMTRAAYFDSLGRLKPSINFIHLLETPDYELAKIGIRSVKNPMKPAIKRELHCDYESVSSDKQSFETSVKSFLAGGARQQSTLQPRNGLYGIVLTHEDRYGSRIDLLARTREVYKLSVWQFPHDVPGSIVFSAQQEKDFYRASNKITEVDSAGWGKIELEVNIPEYIAGVMKVYLYNPGNDTIFFDDLIIEKL